jgi:outer membrane protein TolC
MTGHASPIVAPEIPLTRDQAQASARASRAAQARHASGRRRLVDPATCERDYSAAELEFLDAIQEYKRSSGRMFPTWSEVLEVIQGLGYAKA